MASALDAFLPDYRHRTAHAIAIAAEPARVWRELFALRTREVPFAGLLFGLRMLPALLRGGSLPHARAAGDRTVVDAILGGGFVRLAEDPGRAFALAFTLTPEPGGTRLETETRVQPLGDDAARKFARYWFFVRPGSSLLRRTWLAAVRRRAEAPETTR